MYEYVELSKSIKPFFAFRISDVISLSVIMWQSVNFLEFLEIYIFLIFVPPILKVIPKHERKHIQ
jgi:hypothetical protein